MEKKNDNIENISQELLIENMKKIKELEAENKKLSKLLIRNIKIALSFVNSNAQVRYQLEELKNASDLLT